MPKSSQYDDLARDAAARLDRARARGEQLTFLPDEGPKGEAAGRGPGKALSQMREYLAAKGYRFPEQVLAELAGLASRDDVFVYAMQRAEQVLAWMGDEAANRVWRGPSEGWQDLGGEWEPTPEQRLEVFKMIYATTLRAAEALMPYGLPKPSTDDRPPMIVPVLMPQAPSQAEPGPLAPARPLRMLPADVRYEMQQNQRLDAGRVGPSDDKDRTE